WAGSAMICAEFRPLWAGAEGCDSIVFNPHKWLGVQFDCSAYYVREPADLVRTLAIQPEYLKTHGKDGIINYTEWSVPLGRRFRALKLWFVLRAYGIEGLRRMIRNHVRWSRTLAERIAAAKDFELVTAPMLSLFSFRYAPQGGGDLDALNLRLVEAINTDGRIYLTQTRVDGRVAIRFQVGQFETTEADVMAAFDVILDCAARLGRP
ncbi:MAG: aspartate aminotransferase family protein, partial [Hyphomicrobiales bacterium]|nr:aspartate aminotransferase family protein [Hyphomicrobiales bacterium]